uniref:Uncharacterized protein n=1 Tax=Rhizophora mucronata TaxID=61149 RepID=A0A2P2P6A5_RHIMU
MLCALLSRNIVKLDPVHCSPDAGNPKNSKHERTLSLVFLFYSSLLTIITLRISVK